MSHTESVGIVFIRWERSYVVTVIIIEGFDYWEGFFVLLTKLTKIAHEICVSKSILILQIICILYNQQTDIDVLFKWRFV